MWCAFTDFIEGVQNTTSVEATGCRPFTAHHAQTLVLLEKLAIASSFPSAITIQYRKFLGASDAQAEVQAKTVARELNDYNYCTNEWGIRTIWDEIVKYDIQKVRLVLIRGNANNTKIISCIRNQFNLSRNNIRGVDQEYVHKWIFRMIFSMRYIGINDLIWHLRTKPSVGLCEVPCLVREMGP